MNFLFHLATFKEMGFTSYEAYLASKYHTDLSYANEEPQSRGTYKSPPPGYENISEKHVNLASGPNGGDLNPNLSSVKSDKP